MGGVRGSRGLEVVHCGRVEQLADRLALDLLQAPSDPFEPQVVLVDQPGMERWLAQRIAHEVGVCCNVRFVRPHTYIGELLQLSSDGPSAQPYSAEALSWTLRCVLEELPDDDALEPVRRYVCDPSDALDVRRRKRSALAGRLAAMYGRYLDYRGERVARWAAGEGAGWQAALWRLIGRRISAPTPYEQLVALEEWLAAADRPVLAEPLFLFGLSTVAPLHLRALSAVASRRPVRLFRLLPSPVAFAARTDQARLNLPPLLRRLSVVDRDFRALLDQHAPSVVVHRLAEAGAPGKALGSLQACLRSATEGEPLARLDSSVQIHACHGQIRQVEVLRNALLELFADEGLGIQPRDVVVLCPSIETWSPLIRAVFDDGVDEDRKGDGPLPAPGFPRLRHMVADQHMRAANPVAQTLMKVLELADSRVLASGVLDLLTLEVVRSRFGLSEDDVGEVQRLISETGFRWGLDADHRAEHGRPRDATHTLRFAADRLLLGMAMDGNRTRTFGDVLALNDVESRPARVAGAVAVFADALARTLREVQPPRPFAAWVETLQGVLDRFVRVAPDQQRLLVQVTTLLEASRQAAEAAGAHMDLTLQEVRGHLAGRCSVPLHAPGYVSGAITFCELLPMRSIPFRVVCLLGLDDEAFPRHARRLSFDELLRDPQPGDRDPGKDEPYLLLESIMAAREYLIVTYAGYSTKTNAALPAAPVIQELIDTLARMTRTPGQDLPAARTAVVLEHPLHAFSPREFGLDDRTGGAIEARGFDQRMRVAAQAIASPQSPPAPFLSGALPAPEEPIEVVRLDELRRCLEKGTLWFLMERVLGVREPRDLEQVDDEDPLDFGSLEKWRVGDAAMSLGLDAAAAERLLRLDGALPLGSLGTVRFDELSAEADQVRIRADARRAGRDEAILSVDLEVGGVRLVGRIDGVFGDRRVLHSFTRPSDGRALSAWLDHLVLAALPDQPATDTCIVRRGSSDAPRELRLVGSGALRGVAEEHLRYLVELFIAAHRWPIPFVPGPARAYAEAIQSGEAAPDALAKAQKSYGGGYGGSSAPHNARLMPEGLSAALSVGGVALPAGFDFHTLAERVWLPVLNALAEPLP